jgi:ankyrin repeat protein
VPPGHCEAVRLLLSKGVRVDPIDHRATPLHLAAAKDHDQVVKVLLGLGADVSYLFHPHLTRVLDTYLCYGKVNATNLV